MDEFTLVSLCSFPSAPLLLAVALFPATFLFLLHYCRPRPHPQLTLLPLPPSPPALPLIGHLHLLAARAELPHHTFCALARGLGPIFFLRLGLVPTVVVSSPALARDILKTHDHLFANRPQLVSAQYLSFGCSDVTFSRHGPYWRQARRICVSELLSPSRVASFDRIRSEEVVRATRAVHLSAQKKGVDVSELAFKLANNVLCRVAFGKRLFEYGDGGGRSASGLVEVLKETQELLGGFCVGDWYPQWEWVNWVSGYRGRLMRNLRDLRSVCDEIIREHVGRDGGGKDEKEEDFVDVLLRVQKGVDLEVPITDDNLKALVLDMFVAGTDTTSATLEWAMAELARHPQVMKKAQAEVREIAGSKENVDEAHLGHLHYMKAVIKETLRLHPPTPLLVPRESMDKCILDGYKIPAKTRVLINAYAIGRDPHSWDNPLEYNPERFTKPNVDVKQPDFKFLPFGGGRRGCPGSSFGLATVELALAQLLYHFEWELPQGVTVEDVDMSEIFGLASRKKTPLILIPTTIMRPRIRNSTQKDL